VSKIAEILSHTILNQPTKADMKTLAVSALLIDLIMVDTVFTPAVNVLAVAFWVNAVTVEVAVRCLEVSLITLALTVKLAVSVLK
jgi:hypothetical protein